MLKYLTKKNCAILTVIVFLLTLLPLYAVSRYSYPSADDFFYLGKTLPVWEETASVAAVLRCALEETVVRYHEWQGNFSFIFMTFLQPASFGEEYYGLTGVLVLTVFCLSMLYFLKVLLRDCMGASRAETWLGAFLLTLMAVQFCYEPVEAFYWHPGAISYTFFYALGLVLLGWVLQAVKKERCLLRLLTALPLAVIVGGSNYSTALVAAMVLVLLIAGLLLRRETRTRAVPVTAILLALMAGLIISVVAPGNAIRQSMNGEPSAVKGILVSLAYGAYSMANATTVPVLLGWLALSPILYMLAKKSELSFRWPLVVLVLLFGLYSALGTPCFYALGFAIPERNINLLYFSYYPVVLTALFYVFGWAARKFEGSLFDQTLCALERGYDKVFVCAALLFCVACVGQLTAGKGPNGLEIGNFPAAGEAVFSMAAGEAQGFYAEMEERAALCRASAGEDVVLEPLKNEPELLAYLDITGHVDDWKNRDMAAYYGLKSVRLSE